MPMMITRECHCCRANLHHCEKCWSKFHNSHNGEDFVPPEYYGQPFFPEKITKEVNDMLRKEALKLGREFKEKETEVKPDKNRKYKEGEYYHG